MKVPDPKKISVFVFCPGTFPRIKPISTLRSENCGGKLPILPLFGNFAVGAKGIFHNSEVLPYLGLGAYRIISQLPSLCPYRYGYSVCRITQEEVSVDLKWLWPTMATLGILNLFGLPVVALNVEITGEIEILDSAGNPVATYADEGKAKVYSALYWGYRRHALERVAKAYALIEVLESIKKKIQVDALELREKLLNSGRIS